MIHKATIEVAGNIPSKKNTYKAGGGRIYIPDEVKQKINGLTWQISRQWKGKPKLRHPNMVFRLFGGRSNQDRDNQVQTILDCMVKAGVLVNDDIGNSNGWMVTAPAMKAKKEDEGCVVNLHWEDGAERGEEE